MSQFNKKNVIRMLSLGRAELGETEHPIGSNFCIYNDWFYGKHAKGAWCATFVSWVADHAFGAANPLRGIQYARGYAGTIKAAATMVKKGWQVPNSADWGSGMVFIHKNTAQTGHTGFIQFRNADGTWRTLEGNTDGKGSRTGGQVMAHDRPSSYFTWVFDVPWPKDAAGPAVPVPAKTIYDVWELPNGDIVQVPPIRAIRLSMAQVADLTDDEHEQIKVAPKCASMVKVS